MFEENLRRYAAYQRHVKQLADRKELTLLMIEIHDFHKGQAIDNALKNNDEEAFKRLTTKEVTE